MTKDDLINKISKSIDDGEIDEICFDWLKYLSTQYGNDGKTAKKLIDIAEALLQ